MTLHCGLRRESKILMWKWKALSNCYHDVMHVRERMCMHWKHWKREAKSCTAVERWIASKSRHWPRSSSLSLSLAASCLFKRLFSFLIRRLNCLWLRNERKPRAIDFIAHVPPHGFKWFRTTVIVNRGILIWRYFRETSHHKRGILDWP